MRLTGRAGSARLLDAAGQWRLAPTRTMVRFPTGVLRTSPVRGLSASSSRPQSRSVAGSGDRPLDVAHFAVWADVILGGISLDFDIEPAVAASR